MSHPEHALIWVKSADKEIRRRSVNDAGVSPVRSCRHYVDFLHRVSSEDLIDTRRRALPRRTDVQPGPPCLLEKRFANLAHEAQSCEFTEYGPVTLLMGVSEAQHFCLTATDPAG